MNHNSNEVKQLLARICIHLARNITSEKMSPELLRSLLPMLVNGTKEKNGYVKANSELALIAVLRLRQGDAEHQVFIYYFLISHIFSSSSKILFSFLSFFFFYFIEMYRSARRWRERIAVRRREQSTSQSSFATGG